ncbi:protein DETOXIFICATION 33-like isoform X2 [Papaver somniferum]|uniref:protein DETOXIFICATION 33-like isoform X2 n=1 Tax=Papaver somniferum TaxID=3469 RepID=UPI000E6FA4DE|nr:protein DETOXIFICATION 33-like isoform X2 [Papaver somniferum]
MDKRISDHSTPLLTNKDEIPPVTFVRKLWEENKMVWHIAGPSILISIFQYSMAFVTQTLIGHIGTLELAAVGLQNLVVSGISFGVMLGMATALETLCGQAYGAGKMRMLGIYLQRSWLILLGTSIPLTLISIFATPLLSLLDQNRDIAEVAGTYSIWMIPQLFMYALNFPMQRFLQAQSKVWAMACISFRVLAFHIPLSWFCIMKWGLAGAAGSLNLAWVLLVILQYAYIASGHCKDSWSGFSWLDFYDLLGFLRLSLASAVMLCLEYWYLMNLIVLAGLLKNAKIEVDAASICVRVSNELGAGNAAAAKFSVWVTVSIALVTQIAFALLIFFTRNNFPKLFTNNKDVMKHVSELAEFLCVTIFLSSIQPILSESTGMAVGAGWQGSVAYINIATYYLIGLPAGIYMGLILDYGLEGLWGGVIVGVGLQTIILLIMAWRTDWDKEI